MKRKDTQDLLDRMKRLLMDLKLKTAASELGPRLLKAGGEETLPVVLDVIEMEAKERGDRRIERLRRLSHLHMGKTFDTLDR